LLSRAVNFLKGTATVMLTTPQCERLLFVLHQKGVDFWKIRRINELQVSIKIYEKDLKMFCMVCNRYNADVKVLNSFSAKMLWNKYCRRWGALIAVVVLLITMGILGCFVWDVKVIGCDEKTTENEIINQFQELGFGIGKRRFGIDISDIENRFLLKNTDVFWVSINMRFTTAYIELREKTGKEIKILDLTSPCDIYAARDGQIVSMITTSGSPLVKVGDSVCAGDLLVSREYVDRYGKSIIVHSIATIKAKTQRTIRCKAPLMENVHVPSGKSKTFYTMNLFNFKIPLYFKEKISYNNYDYTERHNVLRIGNFAFPISFIKKTYTEVYVSEVPIEYESAKLAVMSELSKKEKEQFFETEIVHKKVKEETVEGQLVLTADYQCIEDIAYAVGD